MTTRFQINREFYIPKGALKVAAKGLPVVFYTYQTRDGAPAAMCFIGKAQKPAWSFRFRSDEAREKRIADQLGAIRYREGQKAARRAAANKPHGWEAGLILSGSWGYDQTQVDFFEVTRVIGKTMVEIEEIGQQSATDAQQTSMTDHVVPDPSHRTGNVHRVKVSGGSIRSPKHGIATPWNGKPAYTSSYH